MKKIGHYIDVSFTCLFLYSCQLSCLLGKTEQNCRKSAQFHRVFEYECIDTQASVCGCMSIECHLTFSLLLCLDALNEFHKGLQGSKEIDLERHMLTHSDVKPFYYQLCICTFTQKSSLNKHKERFHKGNHWLQLSTMAHFVIFTLLSLHSKKNSSALNSFEVFHWKSIEIKIIKLLKQIRVLLFSLKTDDIWLN